MHEQLVEAPARIGPFANLEPIGRGGMGIVYRAVHVETGQRVAVKTVLVPDADLLSSIRREIQALSRIRHPGVVRVVAHGVDGGLPWYAMALLEGVTLRRFGVVPAAEEPRTGGGASGERSMDTSPLEPTGPSGLEVDSEATAGLMLSTAAVESPAGETASRLDPLATAGLAAVDGGAAAGAPRPRAAVAAGISRDASARLPGILTLMRRLCVPLAYLHGQGIVHRDLKPDNVLVQSNGCPVLVDFGLATHFGGDRSREVLSVEAGAAGTVAYMAPEQIRGELVDARADLYSLGCILYELLTGRTPFAGPEVREILQKHLREPPEPPSKWVAGLPEELDRLLLSLLAKHPKQRLGHADDVETALGQMGAEGWPAAEAAPPRAQPYLYRSGFAGRQGPLGVLLKEVDKACNGSGSVVFVGGESGVGKTRLAMELGRSATELGALVLAGECLASGGRALEGLRAPLQAIADRCRAQGREVTERLFGDRGQVLAMYEPALAELPGLRDHAAPAALPAPAARLRLFSSLVATFAALCEEQAYPVLLILDDLQWADELLLGFLEFLLQSGHLEQVGLLVVGTYRSEEVGNRLHELLGAAESRRVELGRLDDGAVAAIVGDMMAMATAPELFSRYLARHSEGNPFFVAEYLRLAVDEGVLFRDDGGHWLVRAAGGEGEASGAVYEALPLPQSLRDVVGRRLDGLSDAARAFVRAAAVLGREAPLLLVWQVTGLEEEALLAAADELVRRQVLEDGAAGCLRFAHDKLREVTYEGIDSGRRRELHRAAAEGIETVFADDRQERLAELGDHWEQAGEIERARQAFHEAADQARERYATVEAERLYGRAIALWDEAGAEDVQRQLFELHFRRAEMLRLIADFGGVAMELDAVETIAARLGDNRRRAQALVERAHLAWQRGMPLKGEAMAREAEVLAVHVGDVTLQARAVQQQGACRAHQGHPKDAAALFERATALATGAEDPNLRIDIAQNLTDVLTGLNEVARAIPMLQELIAHHRASGNRALLTVGLLNLGWSFFYRGELENAFGCTLEALQRARTIGQRRIEVHALYRLAFYHCTTHEPESALAAAERGAALAVKLSDADLIANLTYLKCQAVRLLGRLDEAEIFLAEALQAAERSNSCAPVPEILAEAAHIAAARFDSRAVAEACRRAQAAIRPEDEEQHGYAIRARLARASLDVGQHERASQHVDSMKRLLVSAKMTSMTPCWDWPLVAVLLAELSSGRDTGRSGKAAREAREHPQLSWSNEEWIDWGTATVARLVRHNPALRTSGFLQHPDFQLGRLLDLTQQ
ncbi:MAG: protein kinase [Candidatus Schekmanbacteria bacterium]|nr:protein kinase [Candidatus Schekmanbacteria bacterium]